VRFSNDSRRHKSEKRRSAYTFTVFTKRCSNPKSVVYIRSCPLYFFVYMCSSSLHLFSSRYTRFVFEVHNSRYTVSQNTPNLLYCILAFNSYLECYLVYQYALFIELPIPPRRAWLCFEDIPTQLYTSLRSCRSRICSRSTRDLQYSLELYLHSFYLYVDSATLEHPRTDTSMPKVLG
jgi:hypothetical protein